LQKLAKQAFAKFLWALENRKALYQKNYIYINNYCSPKSFQYDLPLSN